MQRVVIESPFAGANQSERLANTSYLNLCIRDSLMRGEAPFASHKMYPGALDEDRAEERKLGIEAGYAWWDFWESQVTIVFYTDRGWSPGMLAAKERCDSMNFTYEERQLANYPHKQS